MVDEKCVFELGKTKMPFTPLFKTAIIDADIAEKQNDSSNNTIQLTLSSNDIIENFSGMSFYFEDSEMSPDVEIFLNNQLLPVIKPDDFDNLPFIDWFQHHYNLSEDNQLQYGNYDYWLEFYVRKHINICYINSYNHQKIKNTTTSPVFDIRFKSQLEFQYFSKRSIRINCLPIINVQKHSVVLNNIDPVKKLSSDKSVFLNLLAGENTEKNENDFYIRHFGIERYTQEKLLLQINDLFNRFISDYYAFIDLEDLKKGDKLENLYKDFRELWPVMMRNENRSYSGVYAILKLNKNLRFQYNNVTLDYLTTNCELANNIKEGEKAQAASEFLDKGKTVLLMDTAGGKEVEYNEETLNRLARYNLLSKDKLVTVSDLKAFCYRELKYKIEDVSVQNTGKKIDIQIRLKDDDAADPSEKYFCETLLKQKIKVRSLFSLPVTVMII